MKDNDLGVMMVHGPRVVILKYLASEKTVDAKLAFCGGFHSGSATHLNYASKYRFIERQNQ